MLHKMKQHKQEGFTIIEVLIVLAIAGLILLIVFLAVPALQRNARDTSRKNDISRILGATQEVVNNHNGDVTSLTTANITAAAGSLGYYTATAIAGVAAAPGAATNGDTTDTVHVWTGATCGTGTDFGKAVTGTARQIAITYKIESGGGTIQCTNS